MSVKKEAIFPSEMAKPWVAYSPVVKAGPLVFVSGQVASDFVTGIPKSVEVNTNFPHHGSRIERQTRFICNNLNRCLKAAGSSLERSLFMMAFYTDARELNDAARILESSFGREKQPPTTSVILEELPVPGCSLEIDMIGLAPESEHKIETLRPASLPAPVPVGLDEQPLFRYGTKAGPWVFTAGLTATDYSEGLAQEARINTAFPYYGEAGRLQTEYILKNLQTILAEGGASMADVVKAEVFLTDLNDFYGMEQVWKKYFPKDPPARTTVPVRDLGVPGLKVSINLIAFIPHGKQRRHTIETDKAPKPRSHEPQAVQAGPYLFLSNQFATDYRSGVAAEARVDPEFPYYESVAEKEVSLMARNIEAICNAAGTSGENLVRRRAFEGTFDQFLTSFLTWGKAFPTPPASTTVRVRGPLLVPGCKRMLDIVALVPDEA
jgi:enamine deaminase RidA (YjgF/YER057c/UK114 family)